MTIEELVEAIDATKDITPPPCAEEPNKYSIFQDLTFNLGLAMRYATICEHRIQNGIELAPYMDLLAERVTKSHRAYDQLAKLFVFSPKEDY